MLQTARFPVVLFMCEKEGGRYWVCYRQLGSHPKLTIAKRNKTSYFYTTVVADPS